MLDPDQLRATGPTEWWPNEHEGTPVLYEATLADDQTYTLHGQCSMALPFRITSARHLGADEDRSCDICGELIANTEPDLSAGRISVLD